MLSKPRLRFIDETVARLRGDHSGGSCICDGRGDMDCSPQYSSEMALAGVLLKEIPLAHAPCLRREDGAWLVEDQTGDWPPRRADEPEEAIALFWLSGHGTLSSDGSELVIP